MIKILGFRRILTLAVLVLINLAAGLSAYMYFMPQKETKTRELNGVRSQVSTLKTDIEGLKVEFEKLDEQVIQHEKLKQDGFFDSQSRRRAEEILKEIQERSGVVSAIASIAAGKFEENEEAKKSNHQILKSPIEIRLEAVSDLDVFRYIYLMEEFFPGHVSVENVNIKREADISGVILRAVASGKNPELVTADLELAWRTMIPIEEENERR
ncbi:MAG: hypothetical protein AB8B83_06515 [Bdellovibrionales bacterium]